MADEITFERWTRLDPDGAAWRHSSVVRRGGEAVGEVEVRLAYTAGAELAGDLGREPSESDLLDAMARYGEDEARRRLAAGQDLGPLTTLEIDGLGRGVLRPYLERDS